MPSKAPSTAPESSGGSAQSTPRRGGAASGPRITITDVEEALVGGKQSSRCEDVGAIFTALEPVFENPRIVWGDAASEGKARQEHAVLLGSKLRSLRRLQPNLSFGRPAFKEALQRVAAASVDEWRMSRSEQAEWVEKSAERLLAACRYIAQAELKLKDGRQQPRWLKEVLEGSAPWIYRWDDLHWEAIRSKRDAEPGTTDEPAAEITGDAAPGASPIARWPDGSTWAVPNITTAELMAARLEEAQQRNN